MTLKKEDMLKEWIDEKLFIYLIGTVNKNNKCLIDPEYKYKCVCKKYKYKLYNYYDKVVCKCECKKLI